MRLFKELEEHFDKLAKQLPENQTLVVEVTDVALAGEVSRGINKLRILSDRYPPRIEFTYQIVTADKKLISSGDENLRDLSFMTHKSKADRYNSFGFEKHMLDRWFNKTFSTK